MPRRVTQFQLEALVNERCAELAHYLIRGAFPELLIEEVAQGAWALHESRNDGRAQ